MDITATFRGICKAQKSLSKNLTNGKIKAVPKPAITEFQKNAVEIVTLISKLRDQLLKNRKDYLDCGSTLTDTRRDELDGDAYQQLANCTDLLNRLQEYVHSNRTQIKAHRVEVVQILNIYLAHVSKLLTEQQAIRVRKALERKKLSKLESGPQIRKRVVDSNRKVSLLPEDDLRTNSFQNGSVPIAIVEDEEDKRTVPVPKDVFSTEELQMFEHENMDLLDELSGMEDDVRLIETQLSEISKMNRIITENVLIQEHQIDYVSTTAVTATENVQAGNIDIREAIQKTASFRAWILFVVLVLSFTLLFLDWYNE